MDTALDPFRLASYGAGSYWRGHQERMMGMIDERERHDLHTWAVETMGDERADIFMRSLPPERTDQLARTSDVAGCEDRVMTAIRFSSMELKALIRQESNRTMLALLGAMVALFLGDSVMPHVFPPPAPQIIVHPAGS